MASRSAHATIKGYFYQFDHTILQLLEATAPQSSVVVEGIEDIDLDDGDESAFVQCKYYEGTEYNHSVIKEAVIQMLRHFHKAGCPATQTFKYRLYGHYKGGQHKLSANFDLDFLKENFLSYEHQGKKNVVHVELGVSDVQLQSFLGLLKIELNAPSYDEQQAQIMKLLASQIPQCSAEDASVFYYPNAINVVQTLAIKADPIDRKITKARFLLEISRKDIIFSRWLKQKFGEAYYAKLIKRKHFKFPGTKIPKASRIFAIDMANEFEISKAVPLLAKIGNSFSHVEHTRTSSDDRFCPYVLLRGLTPQELISLKSNLLRQGINFTDGYPFYGSEFSPDRLVARPSKDNLFRLKFIPNEDALKITIAAMKGDVVEIFDFFKSVSLEARHLPAETPYHPIKIDGTYFINEAL